MARTREKIENRLATEMLLLARGYSWPTIKDTLELSDRQYTYDREKMTERKKELIDQMDPSEIFLEYWEETDTDIEQLEFAREDSDSTAAAVSAIRGKEAIGANRIKVAQELGILPKAPERREILGAHRVDVNINDKTELLRTIAERLSK